MDVYKQRKRPRKAGEDRSFEAVMTDLQAAGTEQNCKIYRRHGATDPMFGVSFGVLGQLQKALQVNHPLAQQLWESGNMDAQTLGLKIMDWEEVTADQARRMLGGLSYYMLVDLLVSEIVMANPYARQLMQEWADSDLEYTKRAAYGCLSGFARLQDSLSDSEFGQWTARIEKEIHSAPNRARQMMNIALLNIGLRPDPLHSTARMAAERIGPVQVDHGETSCETYDSAAMLNDPTYLARARKSLKWK